MDALLLENSHDLSYVKPPLPRPAVRLMTRIAREVRIRFACPIGIQLLETANESALEGAAAADLDFLRVERYVFAPVGGAGLIEGCAGRLLRRRHALGADHIRILADLKKKHCAHALTGDLDIVDELKQAEFFLVDGVVVTGARTGEAPRRKEVDGVSRQVRVPVWIGSGITAQNLPRDFTGADGILVGSTFREGGKFLGALDPRWLAGFMESWQRCCRELVPRGNRRSG